MNNIEIICNNIDGLRGKLHEAIEEGNSIKTLDISEKLDLQIVKYTKIQIQLPNND
ncbi:Spo0E family sporulation regulatory protein-aspartic acid phosphatase [Candidatus Clostridium stratigraminis]|uniref:Spo0E family sporulation regulatory protein-aspartic acid phosphatase n=1 Tax=Candidatus Clostridium stratigraminis TaxID=3381661 RepID=A0ABW8T8K7_9CLOT